MKDTYKYDSSGVDEILVSLRQTRGKYGDKIRMLTNLAREIVASSSWKDINVKAQFMNTFNSFLSIYQSTYIDMERYEKYLEKKAKEAREIEEKYTR